MRVLAKRIRVMPALNVLELRYNRISEESLKDVKQCMYASLVLSGLDDAQDQNLGRSP